ncbi:hypothetical protein IMCC21224_112611 [Puniceibacterium sp. IMCC21224]|nr:hypothetical protein IMCC21224_112611 [Puniceibacterium sp. IMCC21224]
MVVFTQFNIPA